MSATERLLEEKAIERIVHDYAYYLDMNQPEKMVELFVDDCEVSYAPNFGASGIEAYKQTLDGIGTFFKGTRSAAHPSRRTFRTTC
jgi:ketosteroid isomerase-like protein